MTDFLSMVCMHHAVRESCPHCRALDEEFPADAGIAAGYSGKQSSNRDAGANDAGATGSGAATRRPASTPMELVASIRKSYQSGEVVSRQDIAVLLQIIEWQATLNQYLQSCLTDIQGSPVTVTAPREGEGQG